MTFDIGKAVQELDVMKDLVGKLSERTRDYLLIRIGAHVRDHIAAQAGRELRTSKDRYLEGLREPELHNGRLIVRLEGAFPVMVEEGAAPFDMRRTLLKRGQRSRAIRFEEEKNASPTLARRATINRQEAVRAGRRLSQDRAPRRRELAAHPPAPRASTPKSGGQSTVYRTISREQDTGWIHPGIDEHDFFGQAEEKIPDAIETVIDGLLEGMLD